MDQQKCFALQIKAERLQEIRTQRMKQFNRSNTQYANLFLGILFSQLL